MAERLITAAEAPMFLRQAKTVWSETEHADFVLYIAGNPEAGDVIPDTGGASFAGANQAPANAAAFG